MKYNRNYIIKSLYNLFKTELDNDLNVELTMDSSRDNNEVLNANVIKERSRIISENGEEKIIKLTISNVNGNSFLSLDKKLDGKRVLINNLEWGLVIEHEMNFDFTNDTIVIKGEFNSINSIDDINEFSIRNSDIIYLYVKNGNLPKLSAFNRLSSKAIFLLLQFQIIAKDDKEHEKIEKYTEEFYNLYYGKYNKTFPIFDKENRKIVCYTNSSFADMSIDDYFVKSDNVMVRIITIPALININYFNYEKE